MDIRFVSSLTAEDENAFAPALLKAIGVLLDQLPLAYTLRIETTGSQVLQHSHTGFTAPPPAPLLGTGHAASSTPGGNGFPHAANGRPADR
jgi:hypothetical protein